MDRLTELVREIAEAIAREVVTGVIAALPDQRPAPSPLTLDADQVGAALNLSKSSVRALWTSGELVSVKIGGLRFTRRADLEAYVAGLEPCLPGADSARHLAAA